MIESKIAEDLLKIKAVSLRPETPFTWSSGWRSPIYCDNRLTLSYPEIRQAITAGFVAHIRKHYPEVQGIAGVATGAIALGALVAAELNLPMVYIRSKAKGHGMQNLVEGHLEAGNKYVVIEDLVSTGKSSVQAVKALQEGGATVMGTVAIFSYGFPQADAAFADTGTPYHSLTNLQATIFEWQQAPESWRQDN